MTTKIPVLLFLATLLVAGCHSATNHQLIGRWQSPSKLLQIEFTADGNYTLTSTGTTLFTNLANIPAEIQNFAHTPPQGAWEIVEGRGTPRLVLPDTAAGLSGSTKSLKVLQLDSQTLVLQLADSPPSRLSPLSKAK